MSGSGMGESKWHLPTSPSLSFLRVGIHIAR